MESALGMDFNLNAQDSFKIGYDHLKSRVEYIFNNRKMKHDTWRVAYWSLKIQRSSILKSGTESDIAKLPAGKGRNKVRQQRTRVNDDGREVKRRRIKNKPRPAVIENDLDDVSPVTQTAFTGFHGTRQVTQEASEIQEHNRNETSQIEVELDNTSQLIDRAEIGLERRRNAQARTQQVHNNVGKEFAIAFSDVPDEFIESAVASSQPSQDSTLPHKVSGGPTIAGMCAGCGLPVSNIHTCDVCRHNMHVFYGKPIGEKGYGQKIRCPSCQRSLDA